MSRRNDDDIQNLGDRGFQDGYGDPERDAEENRIRNASGSVRGTSTPRQTGIMGQIYSATPRQPMFGQPLADFPGQPYQEPGPFRATYTAILEPYTPDFGITDIDPNKVGQILTAFCHRGSKVVGVDVSAIDCTVNELPPASAQISIQWCLDHGMKLFDAVIWLSTSAPKRPAFVLAPNRSAVVVLSNAEISKAVFFIYFYLLTQAKYPNQAAANQPVPSFLRQILGLSEPPATYVGKICTFNITLFDPSWIKSVQFKGFGQETLSRFGLGVAGYRLFAPFKMLNPIAGLQPHVQRAYLFARSVASSPPTWTIHPVTRSSDLLAVRGNLNKNLANLMLECFTTEDLTSLVTHRQLFNLPTRQIGYDNWKNWDPEPGFALADPIFID